MKATMKICDHVSSRDIKKNKREAIYAGAGLRNNQFCLRGLTCDRALFNVQSSCFG